MLSNKPYLIRAFYQWILDSGCTPVLSINPKHPRCRVPESFFHNEEISFNISPEAVRDIKLGNDRIEFTASFSGIVHLIQIPVQAILSIYAHENGEEGMYFDYEDFEDHGDGTQDAGFVAAGPVTNNLHPLDHTQNNEGKKKASHLRIVE